MLTSGLLIEKVLQFALDKLGGKALDLRIDEKKRAAKAFLRLYESILDLEHCGTLFLAAIQPVREGRKHRIYDNWVKELSTLINGASQEFLRSCADVHRVLYIYDPPLATLISHIAGWKQIMIAAGGSSDDPDRADLMHAALPLSRAFTAIRFAFEWSDAGTLRFVRYSSLLRELTSIDIEGAYREATRVTDSFADRSSLHSNEWPSDCLLDLLEHSIVEAELDPRDAPGIVKLGDLVARHTGELKSVREHLAAFIRGQFSLTDLLYSSASASGRKKHLDNVILGIHSGIVNGEMELKKKSRKGIRGWLTRNRGRS